MQALSPLLGSLVGLKELLFGYRTMSIMLWSILFSNLKIFLIYMLNINHPYTMSYQFLNLAPMSKKKGNPNWEEAMQKEIAALDANDTWEIADLPHGKKAIGSKWHYTAKFKPNGTIDKYKARFIVREFT